ncbi:MAG: hypothetical protein K2P94_12585 [Rhodospirillaceae bacterium]|nr:hypothetical protein [Rhodospirillaceae bacterium]
MRRIAALIGWAVFAVALASASRAADLPDFPDADTEKHCEKPGESPECAAKTFWLCSEKSVATCKLVGLDVQPDGSQYKADDTVEGDARTKPWTLSWTELLNVTHANYTVWELKGFRELPKDRLRGVAWSRRALAGSHEMMISMVNAQGEAEKESVFFIQRKGVWLVTGFARWRGNAAVTTCEKRKLGSLACRYTVTGLGPWQLDAPPAIP